MVFVPGGDKPSKDELEKELGDYKLKLTEEADKIGGIAGTLPPWLLLYNHFHLQPTVWINHGRYPLH